MQRRAQIWPKIGTLRLKTTARPPKFLTGAAARAQISHMEVCCPYEDCSKHIAIDLAWAGLQATCPTCNRPFMCPGETDFPPEERLPQSMPPVGSKAGDMTLGPYGIELVWCPPGKVTMGGVYDKAHEVTLTKGFWIGKYPVTQAQWKAVMGSNPSRHECVEQPVEMVSWHTADEFIEKLGGGFRLPTGDEWEYACRAGSTTAFCFGDDEAQLGNYAWHKENSYGGPHPVGEKKPNAWGIYDMHGNVKEWCGGWYSDNNRLTMGGSWYCHALACRSALRLKCDGWERLDNVGFRVAADSCWTPFNP